jgi:hypothetical protein
MQAFAYSRVQFYGRILFKFNRKRNLLKQCNVMNQNVNAPVHQIYKQSNHIYPHNPIQNYYVASYRRSSM